MQLNQNAPILCKSISQGSVRQNKPLRYASVVVYEEKAHISYILLMATAPLMQGSRGDAVATCGRWIALPSIESVTNSTAGF